RGRRQHHLPLLALAFHEDFAVREFVSRLQNRPFEHDHLARVVAAPAVMGGGSSGGQRETGGTDEYTAHGTPPARVSIATLTPNSGTRSILGVSWPGLSRASTPSFAAKTWMPATS